MSQELDKRELFPGAIQRQRESYVGEDALGIQDDIRTRTLESEGATDRNIVLIPGIVDPAEIIFSEQIQDFTDHSLSVSTVDFPHRSFDQVRFRDQLKEFLSLKGKSGKPTTLVGVSFGATCVIDYLRSNPDDLEGVDSIVLIGPLPSIDELNDPVVSRALKLANKVTPALLRKSLMPVVKSSMKADPKLVEKFGEERIRERASLVESRALSEQLQALGREKPSVHLPEMDTKALVIRWEEDYASPDSLEELGTKFTSSDQVIVKGRHAQMATSSSEINKAIIDFIDSI